MAGETLGLEAGEEVGEGGDGFAGGEPAAGAGESREDLAGGEALFAEGGDACVAVALGEAAAVGADHEGQVPEAREREAEASVEDHLGGGGREDVKIGRAHV